MNNLTYAKSPKIDDQKWGRITLDTIPFSIVDFRLIWRGKIVHFTVSQSLCSLCALLCSIHKRRIICLILLGLAGCSRLEESEKEKIRQDHCKTEPIYRKHNEFSYVLIAPEHTPRSLYPWEAESYLPRMTREYFRCRGNPANPPKIIDGASLSDCEGGSHHGLPVLQGREGVYPVLLDLLNYIQKKTGKRVIVTCGHRCPTHNAYSDASKEARTSKHQIGAEVDFYVQGMEECPLEVVGLLMQYYREMPLSQTDPAYRDFKRYEPSNTASQSWMNKEIFIKILQKSEGRDFDNRHPYPYISLQVRFCRDTKARVVYEWAKAHQGYPRG